jgi:topoisomerase-4 subunit B
MHLLLVRLVSYNFSNGLKKSELEVVGAVGERNTGTKVKFTPDAQFFDT